MFFSYLNENEKETCVKIECQWRVKFRKYSMLSSKYTLLVSCKCIKKWARHCIQFSWVFQFLNCGCTFLDGFPFI